MSPTFSSPGSESQSTNLLSVFTLTKVQDFVHQVMSGLNQETETEIYPKIWFRVLSGVDHTKVVGIV